MGKKSIQKSIIFWMPLGIDFCVDFCGFGVPKWSQVGTKMGSNKISQKTRKNAFGASPLVPNWVQGSKLGAKIDQTSTKLDHKSTKNDVKLRAGPPEAPQRLSEGSRERKDEIFWWSRGTKIGQKTEEKKQLKHRLNIGLFFGTTFSRFSAPK